MTTLERMELEKRARLHWETYWKTHMDDFRKLSPTNQHQFSWAADFARTEIKLLLDAIETLYQLAYDPGCGFNDPVRQLKAIEQNAFEALREFDQEDKP